MERNSITLYCATNSFCPIFGTRNKTQRNTQYLVLLVKLCSLFFCQKGKLLGKNYSALQLLTQFNLSQELLCYTVCSAGEKRWALIKPYSQFYSRDRIGPSASWISPMTSVCSTVRLADALLQAQLAPKLASKFPPFAGKTHSSDAVWSVSLHICVCFSDLKKPRYWDTHFNDHLAFILYLTFCLWKKCI